MLLQEKTFFWASRNMKVVFFTSLCIKGYNVVKVMHKGCKKLGPKDYFTIPRIDQRVDSTTKCQRLSF